MDNRAAPAKIILLCGKIASGKSYYAAKLLKQSPSVLLSMDELFEICELDFFNDLHSNLYPKLQQFLYKKAAEIAQGGLTVILDSGFWTRQERQSVTKVFSNLGSNIQWHYIDVDDDTWRQNIEERNQAAQAEGYVQFLIDEERMAEIIREFEVPAPDEIDVWVHNQRTED